MTDMRRARLPQGAHADHSICTLSVCVAYCPPPPVARKLSNPSWKVIVSASRGQYLKPGSNEPGFFSHPGFSNSICPALRSRMRRAVPRLRRGVLLIRGPHTRHTLMGPGSAEQRDRTMLRIAVRRLHRVRDTKTSLVKARYRPADRKLADLGRRSRG